MRNISLRDLHSRLEVPGNANLSVVTWNPDREAPLRNTCLPVSLERAGFKRRREFLMGRHCARRALKRSGFTGAAQIPINIDRTPQWPEGWVGSISHCRDAAIAIAAPLDKADLIGIDIENSDHFSGIGEIESMIVRSEEIRIFSGWMREDALTLIFSAKESLFKALYPDVRRFFDFKDAFVSGRGENFVDLRLTSDWSTRWRDDMIIRVQFLMLGRRVITLVVLPRAT